MPLLVAAIIRAPANYRVVHLVILEYINIDKEILENIDINKILNRLEFGISNRASRSKSKCRYIATSGARRANLVNILQKKSQISVGQVTSLSWIQLRQECLKAGLPAMGKKSEMIARLGWDKA